MPGQAGTVPVEFMHCFSCYCNNKMYRSILYIYMIHSLLRLLNCLCSLQIWNISIGLLSCVAGYLSNLKCLFLMRSVGSVCIFMHLVGFVVDSVVLMCFCCFLLLLGGFSWFFCFCLLWGCCFFSMIRTTRKEVQSCCAIIIIASAKDKLWISFGASHCPHGYRHHCGAEAILAS